MPRALAASCALRSATFWCGIARRPWAGREALAQRLLADRAAVQQQEVVEQHAFLVDRARGGRHGAGRDAADVGVVRARGDEEGGRSLVAGEDRAHDRDVGQVRAARVGRVQHPGAAAAQFARVRGDDGADARAHRAEVHGHVRRVRDERARGVEQGAGEIEALADVHRDGGRLQHRAHLLRDLHETVIEELELRRIGAPRIDGRGRAGARLRASLQRAVVAAARPTSRARPPSSSSARR